MDSAQTFGQPPSGLPPLAYLSGLPLGQGMSGAQDPSLAGAGQASQGGAGQAGGLSLQELQALFAAAQGGGDTSAASGLPLGQLGGFGNIAGGGSFGAGGQLGQGPTGQAGVNPGVAGGTGGGLDAMAILRQALGLGSQAAKLFPGQQGYQTIGDTGGVSLSDQLRSGQAGTASPMIGGITGYGGAPGGGDVNAPGVPQGLQDPNALGGLPSQNPTIEILNQAQGGIGGIPQGTAEQELMQQMLAQGASPDQIVNAIGALGFGAGEIPGGGSIPSGQTLSGYQSGQTGGTDVAGIAGGGLQGLSGLLGLGQGIQGLLKGGQSPLASGAQLGGSALTTYNALSQLFPDAFPALGQAALSGLSSIAPETASALGAGAGAAGAGLGGVFAGGFGPSIVSAGSDVSEGLRLDQNERLVSQILQAIPVIGTPLAMVTNAIEQAFNPASNYGINKLSGQLGPQVIGNLEKTADLLPQGFDLNQLPTSTLEDLVPRYGSALSGYYSAAGAGMPSGTGGDATAVTHYLHGLQETDPAAYAQSQQALGTNKSDMLQAIADLQQRGIDPGTIGGLMGPQINAIGDMYNSDTIGGPANGYIDPRGLMAGGFSQFMQPTSYQQLAGLYGGPTWLALNQMYGSGLGGVLGQYGINGPQADFSSLLPDPAFAAQQAATQYQGAPASAQQIASQYGGYTPSATEIWNQYHPGYAPDTGFDASGDAGAGG